MPVRESRLKETIRFEVRAFAMDDPLEEEGGLFTVIREFAHQTRIDGELREFQAFEAHPESSFRVGDVYTRRPPFPSFQVLSHALLKKGSDSLLDSPYYARFTPEMLCAVGMPR